MSLWSRFLEAIGLGDPPNYAEAGLFAEVPFDAQIELADPALAGSA